MAPRPNQLAARMKRRLQVGNLAPVADAAQRRRSSRQRVDPELLARVQARLPQPGERGGQYRRSEVNEIKDAAPEVSVPLQRGPGPSGYTTRIEGDTVHHRYNDGVDRSFHVDNADERRLLAEAGGDYGDLQRHSGDAGAFRDQIHALAQFRAQGAMPDEQTRAGLQTAAERSPAVMAALRSAMQLQAQRQQGQANIAAGNNPGGYQRADGSAPPAVTPGPRTHGWEGQPLPTGTGGIQAPSPQVRAQLGGLERVQRTAAQMRADNPEMVQRVKRRMRARA